MNFKIDFDTSTQIISVIYSGATDLGSKLRAVEEVTQTYADKEVNRPGFSGGSSLWVMLHETAFLIADKTSARIVPVEYFQSPP